MEITKDVFVDGPLNGMVYIAGRGRRPSYLDEDAATVPVAQGDAVRWGRRGSRWRTACYVRQADGSYLWMTRAS